MTIYVVERMGETGCIQLGWSTKREVAEKMRKEYEERAFSCYVEEYALDKNEWCDFD